MQTSGSLPFHKKREFISQKTDGPPPEEKPPEETAMEEAHKDIIRDTIKESEKNLSKLDQITELSEFILYRTKTAFPLDPFPDEVIVDTYKVSIIHNSFPSTGRVHSVMINNISDVFVDHGMFWAKLTIVDRGFSEEVVFVEYLKKEDAIRIRRIVQGLVVSHHQGVDLSKLKQDLSEDEIIEKIEKLGKARVGDFD